MPHFSPAPTPPRRDARRVSRYAISCEAGCRHGLHQRLGLLRRRGQRLLPLLSLSILLSLGLLPTDLHAAPLISSRVGGLSLIGPASRHPASLFYSPATLGFLHGHHLYLDGVTALSSTHIERRHIDPRSGAPTSGSFAAESSLAATPQLFAAGISDLGLDALVIGLAVHTPTWERTSYASSPLGDLFDGKDQGPSRYHGVSFSLVQLHATLGAALRITKGWYLGFSTSYVFGSLRYAFVRDAALLGGSTRDAHEAIALDDCGGGHACGFEADRAAEAITVTGTSHGLGFAAGLVGRVHPNVVIGIGYVSTILGLGGDEIPARGEAWVRRSDAVVESAGASSSDIKRDLHGRSLITYQLPDIITAGVTWKATWRLTLALQLRWLTYRRHSSLDIQLTGTEFRQDPEIPREIIHYRGFQDVFAGQIGAAYHLTQRLELQGATMVESSAVSPSAASAIATEGWKIDTFIALRYWATSRFSLRVGYGIVWIPSFSSASSTFDPATLSSCVDDHFNVDEETCKLAAAGHGLASTAGTYGALLHRFGASIAYDWK